MRRYLFSFMTNLKLRWKMLVLVMPLVIIPIFVVGGVIGYISTISLMNLLPLESTALRKFCPSPEG